MMKEFGPPMSSMATGANFPWAIDGSQSSIPAKADISPCFRLTVAM